MDYTDLVQTITVHLLVSIRFLALIMANPVFTAPAWPMAVRFWLSMMLAMIVIPASGITFPDALFSSWTFIFIMAVREYIIGTALGFFTGMPLYILQMSGFFEGHMMGLAMATLFDPMSQNQVALIGQLKYLVGVWFFFHWNGHLLLVQALTESLKLIPIAKGAWGGGAFIPWSNWLQQAMVMSMTISLPLMGALLLADVGLGFVARTVPQMNIFILGIPIKIGLGLFLILAVLPITVDVIHNMIERVVEMALEGAYLWK